jgi:hypothetical protein
MSDVRFWDQLQTPPRATELVRLVPLADIRRLNSTMSNRRHLLMAA